MTKVVRAAPHVHTATERARRKLHGRYLGLYSHVSRDNKRVAFKLRKTKGLPAAIAFLSSVRRRSDG